MGKGDIPSKVKIWIVMVQKVKLQDQESKLKIRRGIRIRIGIFRVLGLG